MLIIVVMLLTATSMYPQSIGAVKVKEDSHLNQQSPDTTESSKDSSTTNTRPSVSYRHRLYMNAGIGWTLSQPQRLSKMGQIRYDWIGINWGSVESETVPSASVGILPDTVPVERFDKRQSGVDASVFHNVLDWLSLYGSIGMYWNDFVELSKSSDGRYVSSGEGSETRVSWGAGVQADVSLTWPRPYWLIMLGCGIHSQRGIVGMVGWGVRF